MGAELARGRVGWGAEFVRGQDVQLPYITLIKELCGNKYASEPSNSFIIVRYDQ